jgi:ribonuclease VapC
LSVCGNFTFNVTLYWMTETIHSSFRWYDETRLAPFQFLKDEFVRVPCAIAAFPKTLRFRHGECMVESW